jgi:hypothetical protein
MRRRKVVVLQAARNRNMVELATVKTHLSISGSAEDATLARHIRAASDLLASDALLGYAPWREKIRETLAGNGRLTMRPSRHPIETLVSITRDDSDVGNVEIIGDHRDQLYREYGFECDRVLDGSIVAEPSLEKRLGYVVTMYTGWLMPGEATTWAAATAYTVGKVVTLSAYVHGDLFLECTTAGTSGASAPALPAEGSTVTDGTVTWTARACEVLPSLLEQDALTLTKFFYDGENERSSSLAAESGDGTSLAYNVTNAAALQRLPALYGVEAHR